MFQKWLYDPLTRNRDDCHLALNMAKQQSGTRGPWRNASSILCICLTCRNIENENQLSLSHLYIFYHVTQNSKKLQTDIGFLQNRYLIFRQGFFFSVLHELEKTSDRCHVEETLHHFDQRLFSGLTIYWRLALEPSNLRILCFLPFFCGGK